jgi:hypothetical protein
VTDTATDRRTYLESGLTAIDCGRCGAAVQVRKSSTAQTSIQWTAQAQRRCRAFEVRAGCPDLHRAIDDAVTAGELPVGGD